MNVFFLLLSMFLHVVTILAVLLLLQKTKNSSVELERQKREIEKLLSLYASEMKEDNEQFLMRLKEILNASDAEREKVNEMAKVEAISSNEHYEPPLPQNVENYEQSLAAQVFNLSQQGHTANEIAKMLNKGKGEVELLLKFRH